MHVLWTFLQVIYSRQSAKPFLKSSELGLPQPLTRRRVCPPPPGSGGEGHTRWRESGWESSNYNVGTYTVVLFINTYFVICSLHHENIQAREL
jgi:hypothetical protein